MEIEPSAPHSSNLCRKFPTTFFPAPVSRASTAIAGLESLLLKESLLAVAKHGISNVLGITRSTSSAAKFVYPKFGGTSESYEMPMGDVAMTH